MTQARKLHNLAMVHEEVNIDTKLTDVPVVHLGIGSLKHDAVLGKLLHDAGDDVGAPRINVLGDAFGLNHQALDACIEELVAEVYQLSGVGGANGFQAGGWGVTTGTELDA